jgi:hypothetical protein
VPDPTEIYLKPCMLVLPMLPKGSNVLKREVVLSRSRFIMLLFNDDWFDPELFDMIGVNS